MDQPNKRSTISEAYSVIPILSFRKADIIVLILAVILGVGAPLMTRFVMDRQVVNDGELMATLTVSGEVLWHIPILAEAQEEEFFSFEGDGYDITVGYNGVSVWFESSNCPDQTCVQMGAVSDPGRVAICVPNRAMLSVATRETRNGQASSSNERDAGQNSDEPDIVVGRIGG